MHCFCFLCRNTFFSVLYANIFGSKHFQHTPVSSALYICSVLKFSSGAKFQNSKIKFSDPDLSLLSFSPWTVIWHIPYLCLNLINHPLEVLKSPGILSSLKKCLILTTQKALEFPQFSVA